MALGVAIFGAWLLYFMFFLDKSAMVIFSKTHDTITINRYFALDRCETTVARLSDLSDVHPVVVNGIMSGQQLGYNIVLLFNDGTRHKLFTSDHLEFQVYVSQID